MNIKELFKNCNQAFRQTQPTFDVRLLYAELSNAYNSNCDSRLGYIDGAKECLEGNKTLKELECYINTFEATEGKLDEYERAYVLAYRDYIKQERMKGGKR